MHRLIIRQELFSIQRKRPRVHDAASPAKRKFLIMKMKWQQVGITHCHLLMLFLTKLLTDAIR